MFEQFLPYQFLFGTLVGLFIALMTTKMNTQSQLKIAEKNTEKDTTLQKDRLINDRRVEQIKLERKKLEELHKILLRIDFENSLTKSYIQSTSNMEISEFRIQYMENCERMRNAIAMIAIYFPEMSEEAEQVYSQAGLYWGYQEGVLSTDIKTNKKGYQSNLDKVSSAVSEISKLVRSLKIKIISRAKQLNEHYLD